MRQDGPGTVHLKLDKTWHLDKILFKVSYVVSIRILRAFVLGADKKPETNF